MGFLGRFLVLRGPRSRSFGVEGPGQGFSAVFMVLWFLLWGLFFGPNCWWQNQIGGLGAGKGVVVELEPPLLCTEYEEAG